VANCFLACYISEQILDGVNDLPLQTTSVTVSRDGLQRITVIARTL
jgi:hypothetical protein